MATSFLKLAETAYRPAQLHSEYIKYFSYQNEGYQSSCDFYKRRKQGNILYKQTILYFLKTLCTRTKAVNFGQSRCGVAACRPTSLVVAQPQDRPSNDRDVNGLMDGENLHDWSKVLEQPAPQPSLLLGRGRLPVIGGIDNSWLIVYQGNQRWAHPSPPLTTPLIS